MINFIQIENLNEALEDSKPFLIDVRSQDEYEAGHYQGAIHIPWETIEEKVSGIPLTSKLILYCKTGVRAMKASRMLENIGYKDLNVLLPGYVKATNNA